MTKINRIVMQGFKSFAKTTELPFDSGFNVVLGPNGSGKSNVTDAICFVLGKLGAKGLRAEKQANLIYDGGKTKSPAKFAAVSIYFDNSGKEFPYEGKEIVISRRVLPTGNSLYKINDIKSSRKEIIDLLSLAKIDPNGYNIILQGDIAKFVEMSTESRRQVIEEIADITLYEDKKRQALLELNKVDDKLKEAKIVLTERKTYLDELRVEHRQAKRYKEMTDRIDSSKATYYHLKILDRTQSLENIDSRSEKMQGDISKNQSKLSELKGASDETQKGIDKINAEIEEKGEKGQVDMHKKIEDLRVNISANSARIEGCKEELNKIEQRREGLKRQETELDERLGGLSAEVKQLESDKKKLLESRTEIQKKLALIKQKYNVEDTTRIESQVTELDNFADDLSSELLTLREKQQELMRTKDSLEMQLNNLEQRIEKLAEVEATNKKELVVLKELKTQFKIRTVELNKKLNEDSAMAARLATLRDQLLKSREELVKLSQKQSSLNEHIAGNMAIKKVLERRDPGVFGTVSSLGSVSSKFSLSLDVAAGSHLKDIVVNDDSIAVKCIKYLKENRLGIATFLPLNKLRVSPSDQKIRSLVKADGVQGLAIDLLKYDPKYAKIFQWVFRDTLIVDNIDVARRLGVGTARMVTIDGDLVDRSGAMVGGYRRGKKSSLGFQEEEVTKNLSEVKARVSTLTNQVVDLEQEKVRSEEIIVALKHKKADLEAEIIKSERSLHLDSDDLGATANKREILSTNLSVADKALAILLKEIADKTKQLTEKKMEKERLKQKLLIVRDPKLLGEINSYEEKIRSIHEELVRIDGHIKNNTAQGNEVFRKELDRVHLVLKQLIKEEKGFTDEIDKKIKTNNELDAKLEGMESKAQAFYSKYKELFKNRNEFVDKLRELDVKKAELNEQTRQIELKLNQVSLDRATIKAQLAGLEEESKQFKDVGLFEGKTIGELKREIDRYEGMVATFGTVNLKSLEIYDAVEEEYKNLTQKRELLLKEKEDVGKMMEEIELKKKGLFIQSFEKLNLKFQEFFKKLSAKGGEAFLTIENEENPFDGGVQIRVKRTGKRYVDLRSLSGGEKAMTALSLIFAIQEYDPATFYIMDEVDAALDKQNSEKLGKLIKEYSSKAQYIVVSHNDYIIQGADTLFGVSMSEHGISKIISLKI